MAEHFAHRAIAAQCGPALRRKRFCRSIRRSRRTRHPQGRRNRGAGTRFRVGWRRRYLRALEADGVALDQICRTNFLPARRRSESSFDDREIPRVTQTVGARRGRLRLHASATFVSAETSSADMMTRRDPYGNMVRTTIAALAAATGGADAVRVLPFTAARPARSLCAPHRRQRALLIRHEANLANSRSGGPRGAFEDLTDQLVQTAWTFPSRSNPRRHTCGSSKPTLSREGRGCASSASASRRNGRDPIIGTSDYPDRDEAGVRCSRRWLIVCRSAHSAPMRLAAPFKWPRRRYTASDGDPGRT